MMSVIGSWSIRSSPDFDESYLHMERPAYVTFQSDGDRIAGNFQVGLQTGFIDGRQRSDGSVQFTFEGTDEMDEVSGAGTATIEGERLILTLMYHQGDDYTFEATRDG
jgi:hypothetical protein